MGNVEKAILLSVLTHALLAFAFAFGCRFMPGPVQSARLDVSEIELSLSDSAQKSISPSAHTQEKKEAVIEPAVNAGADSQAPQPETSLKNEVLPVPAAAAIPQAAEPIVEMHSSSAALDQAKVDAPAKPMQAILPHYPNKSRRRGEEGLVKLTLSVNAMGRVSEASVLVSSGFKELDAAALKAVRSALFLPALRGNDPVDSTLGLTFVFKLE
jgi:protein TonB